MPDDNDQEINQSDHPEVEQLNIPEFEQSTDHPQEDNTRMQSQLFR